MHSIKAPEQSGAFLFSRYCLSLHTKTDQMYYDPAKINTLDINSLLQPLEELRNCRICPRNCGADRFSNKLGYCRSDASFYISSICIHRGEEPPISGENGICNIFFGHCNLQCVYCQNHQISINQNPSAARRMSLQEVLQEIIRCLNAGCRGVGFVSPGHFVPQVKIIINALKMMNINPITVYNTNGYDKLETLRNLEPFIDVYLPDCKYFDSELSRKYSDAKDYPTIVAASLKEMYRQKGSTLLLDDDGLALQGILIRHLVLPGHVQNSLDVLTYIADEISTSLHISLMSQYHPVPAVNNMTPLHRTLYSDEYQQVVAKFHELGFRKGWIQELDSNENYRPDFEKDHPFEG